MAFIDLPTTIAQYAETAHTKDVSQTCQFLVTVTEKALRYDRALYIKAQIPACRDYVIVKESFKNAVNACFDAGYTVQELVDIAHQMMTSAPSFHAVENFETKINRYFDKFVGSNEPTNAEKKLACLSDYITSLKSLEMAFVEVKSLSSHDGTMYKDREGNLVAFDYSEYRRAKKGVPGESYVGYVKFLKKNWSSENPNADTVKQHEKFLVSLLNLAGVDAKVVWKITHFEDKKATRDEIKEMKSQS